MIELRPYQVELIEKTRSLMRSGVKSIMIQSPVGSGKTALTAAMLKTAAEKGKRCWFTVHRRELILQSVRAFSEIGVPVGIIGNGFHTDPKPMVQVVSVQSAVRRLKYLPVAQHPELLVHDEAHHMSAGSWQKIYREFPNSYHVGLSASPQRLDGQGLDLYFENMINGPSVQWLIEQGYLSPYRAYAPSSPSLVGVHTRMGDFVTSELETVIDQPTITGSAILEYQRHAAGKRAIIFAVSIKHSKRVVSQFNQAGIKAAHIDGDTDRRERDSLLKQFSAGTIKVISNCSIFSEGFDCPAIECVILLRPTQSLGMHIQQIGRGLRASPGKEYAVILDHAGNIQRHGLPCEEREWSLQGRSKTNRASSNGPSMSVKICERCFAAQASTLRDCPFCGHEHPIQHREVEEEDGDLQEIDPKQVYRKRMKEQSQAADLNELIKLGKERGYKHPYAWAKRVFNARQAKKLKGGK